MFGRRAQINRHVLVLSDVPGDDPVSGAEQVLYQHIRGLPSHFCRVSSISRRNVASGPILVREMDNGLQATYPADPTRPLYFLFSLFRHTLHLFDRISRHYPVDAIVSHQPFTMIPLMVSGRMSGVPLIYIYHSPSHEEYLHSKGGKRALWRPGMVLRRAVEGIGLRKADCVVALSRFMAERSRRFHHLSASRTKVVPGGVDTCRFRPRHGRHDLKIESGFPKDQIHLLTVRNLEPRMGVDNLIRAMKMLVDSWPVHLTIGGTGPDYQRLADLVEELALGDQVTLTGFVPESQLPLFYAAADFFVIPTRALEGFGLVILESMACGTPVMGTPVGGIVEILSTFDPQFLFKGCSPEAMAEGIASILSMYPTDDDRYQTLRHGCRSHVKRRFTWERHLNQVAEILNELAER